MRESRTKQEGHDHDVCPNCGAELCGGRIYEDWAPKHAPGREAEYAESYGAGPLTPEDRRHICGSQIVGIELPLNHPNHYDGVSYWRYPCCDSIYDRFTGERMEDHGLGLT